MSELLNIKNYIKNKNIFITGGTGFLGKVLIEKLLRDCNDLNKLYVLLRVKSDEKLCDKLEKFKNNQIFNRIRNSDETLLNKLSAINGDLICDRLNLTSDSINILMNDVNIIFNVAATVKFNETFKNAILTNVRGTHELLKLAKQMHNLQSFIHVSTAFAHSNEKFIQEICYKSICDYNFAITAAETNDLETLDNISKMSKKFFPNSYVFSKNLAEKLIYDSRFNVPVAIVRPPLITPAYKEPYPGWVDCISGPMGILIGAGSGVIRSVHGNGLITPDLLPVDFCVNAMIAAATKRGQQNIIKNPICQIYNCTTSSDLPITWEQFLNVAKQEYKQIPFDKVIWSPGGNMTTNYLIYILKFIIFQYIPAIFMDLMLLVLGKKLIFTKLQYKIFRTSNLVSYFLNEQWHWKNTNFRTLYNNLSASEKYTFNFNVSNLDYRQYISNWIYGNRKFILKCNDQTIPYAKRKLRLLCLFDVIIKIVFLLIVTITLYRFFNNYNLTATFTTIGVHRCNSCNKLNFIS